MTAKKPNTQSSISLIVQIIGCIVMICGLFVTVYKGAKEGIKDIIRTEIMLSNADLKLQIETNKLKINGIVYNNRIQDNTLNGIGQFLHNKFPEFTKPEDVKVEYNLKDYLKDYK